MFCGSCLRDNTLVTALRALGHDAILVPTYTPIRTDEIDVSLKRIFFGGINVFLQQKLAFFRHTPGLFDWLLDRPRLLRWVSRYATRTEARDLGELTVSMLKGEQGNQRKEVNKLAHWLGNSVGPDILNLSNVMLSGMAHEISRSIHAPIICSLQGDDIFLDALPDPHRGQALALIAAHSREIDGFIATSHFYADYMSEYLGVARDKIHVVYPGLNLNGHDGVPSTRNEPPFTIGYFARICPEKGLHILAEAFHILQKTKGAPPCRLRVSGWLGENQKSYLDGVKQSLNVAGLSGEFEYVESPDLASKATFFKSLDILSVPTTYREPKGLYVLEAWANGVPVVQPRHGSFPELIEATGGGLLCKPDDPADLALALWQLLEDHQRRHEMAHHGQAMVRERFHASRMARETVEVYGKYVR